MKDKVKYFEFNQEKLKKLLREHRKNQKLSQNEVAEMVGKSLDTYQRWESSGQRLTDIFTLLSVFQVLKISTSEIIDVLGLRPLTLSEVEDIYQDENTLKSIEGNGICSAMRKKCPDMDDFILERLISILFEEHSKRLESRNGNS